MTVNLGMCWKVTGVSTFVTSIRFDRQAYTAVLMDYLQIVIISIPLQFHY